MGNRSYLYRSDHPRINPARIVAQGGMEGFDEKRHTLLAGNLGVPLMWLTMFSVDSLVSERFAVANDHWTQLEDGELLLETSKEVILEAPLCDAELSLERISRNTPKLEAALGQPPGALHDYAHNLRLAVQSGSGSTLTVDYEELQWMTGAFHDAVRAVLTYFDGGSDSGVLTHCMTLAESLQLDRPLLPATGFFDGKWADEDLQNLESLLGSGWLGDAPWEMQTST